MVQCLRLKSTIDFPYIFYAFCKCSTAQHFSVLSLKGQNLVSACTRCTSKIFKTRNGVVDTDGVRVIHYDMPIQIY